MPLAAGMRLGPFEVLSRLGAGGMGEVWRARDSRLQREVANAIASDLSTAVAQSGKTENPSLRAASANRSSSVTNGTSAGWSSAAASEAASCSASADRSG